MSRYLLDTHVWLWMTSEPERISEQVRRLLVEPAIVLLSAASVWEISIKYRLGKLPLRRPPAQFVPDLMRVSGTIPLAVEHDHALRVADLPDHHADPFDRLLVAQAQSLRVPLVSADPMLRRYDIELLTP